MQDIYNHTNGRTIIIIEIIYPAGLILMELF